MTSIGGILCVDEVEPCRGLATALSGWSGASDEGVFSHIRRGQMDRQWIRSNCKLLRNRKGYKVRNSGLRERGLNWTEVPHQHAYA